MRTRIASKESDRSVKRVGELPEKVNYIKSGKKPINRKEKPIGGNPASANAMRLEETGGENDTLQFNLPEINLDHIKKMTTGFGITQFSKLNQPDSGYTLDDNARAMVAACMYFKLTRDQEKIEKIRLYLNFIKKCHQPSGNFLNYVDKDAQFTSQNKTTNLEDANGGAIWALGYLVSLKNLLPRDLVTQAATILNKSIHQMGMMRSTRAMAFTIKGMYFSYVSSLSPDYLTLLVKFANRLVQMYKHESSEKWEWFESHLSYANSILPEALLYAWMLTGESTYRDIARTSLSFLLSQTFTENGIEVISGKDWLYKGEEEGHFGEQPIDVAYTVMTLSRFYDETREEDYRVKMEAAFNWFLGKNRLHQVIYNPGTGGCYDGLGETHVNLNQGAESTIGYLMARLTIEKYKKNKMS